MVNRFAEQEIKMPNYIVVKCDGKQGMFRINEFSDSELNELKVVLFTQLFKAKLEALALQTSSPCTHDSEVICDFIRKINEELQNRFNEKTAREVKHV